VKPRNVRMPFLTHPARIVLQWGRGREAAERAEQLGEGGEIKFGLQWGRGREAAERRSARACASGHCARFNGAAAVKPRNVPSVPMTA